MLTSLAYLFLLGFAIATLCKRIKLPGLIGMLLTGILLGPYVFGRLDPKILSISSELRQLALIIILIKAGLSLDLSDLKKVGRPAVLLSFVPASLEILAYTLFAPPLLGISGMEGALMGAVLGAVSPAVVVPKMVELMEKKRGTRKGIPQMIMAGASCDDIFVIVLFTTFLGIVQGGKVKLSAFLSIPSSILLGIALGILAGFLLYQVFEGAYRHRHYIRNSNKVILILGLSFLLISIENSLKGKIAISGLLAIVSMACVLKRKSLPSIATRLSQKFGKLWLAAELVLFVLVGAAVDIRYTLGAGLAALLLIFLALLVRSLGVWLALFDTPLLPKERLFCVVAYLPKATVQAAIGSVPLSLGLSCGPIILSVAVLAILITAPLGAFGMNLLENSCLSLEENGVDEGIDL